MISAFGDGFDAAGRSGRGVGAGCPDDGLGRDARSHGGNEALLILTHLISYLGVSCPSAVKKLFILQGKEVSGRDARSHGGDTTRPATKRGR